MQLSGKVAVITGAGQGIGFSIAESFARAGASLVLNDFNVQAGRLAVQRVARLGAQAVLVAGDVSRSATARKLARAAKLKFGGLDILVNNAGVGGSAHGDGPVSESKEESWDTILRVNLKSVFLCSRYAIPEMLARGGGSVINISSILALSGCAEHFTSHAYVASKGAMISLTRAMAAYYARMGVRVNAICPGMIETPLTLKSRTRRPLMDYVAKKQPLVHGLGASEDVASSALFLASEASKLITGVVLPVDGGWSTGL